LEHNFSALTVPIELKIVSVEGIVLSGINAGGIVFGVQFRAIG
jgi:hypothetical protein